MHVFRNPSSITTSWLIATFACAVLGIGSSPAHAQSYLPSWNPHAQWHKRSQPGEGSFESAAGSGVAARTTASATKCAVPVTRGPHGTTLVGRPGPGVYKTHINNLSKVVGSSGYPLNITGSRQTGISKLGKSFHAGSDIDLMVFDIEHLMSDLVDDIFEPNNWFLKGIENVDHGPMGLADLDEVMKDPKSFSIFPKDYPNIPKPSASGARVFGASVAGGLTGMATGMVVDKALDKGLQAVGVNEDIAGGVGFAGGYVAGAEASAIVSGSMLGAESVAGTSGGLAAVAVAPLAAHTFMMQKVASSCNDASASIEQQSARSGSTMGDVKALGQLAEEHRRRTEYFMRWGGLGALRYGFWSRLGMAPDFSK